MSSDLVKAECGKARPKVTAPQPPVPSTTAEEPEQVNKTTAAAKTALKEKGLQLKAVEGSLSNREFHFEVIAKGKKKASGTK